MNKILIILAMFISNTLLAAEVLDSEATDFESESNYCLPPSTTLCTSVTEYKSTSTYIFHPHQLNGVFRVQPNWYMVTGKMRFVPVLR
ncbi:hypothetical protein MNBD_GAMMA08-740 [hydrothermal vent metagenome]|uniref:Uncharacterized protein n=1 Tax=hydrothermal vent metagenome TaxID=652676 RepID=A0A3B0WUG2_9ZZZZ